MPHEVRAGRRPVGRDDVDRRRPGSRPRPRARASRSAVSGVCGSGLSTTEQPGRERRRELPRRHQQRVVPRHDLPGDADRLLQRVGEQRAADRVRAAGDRRDRGGEEAEVLDGAARARPSRTRSPCRRCAPRARRAPCGSRRSRRRARAAGASARSPGSCPSRRRARRGRPRPRGRRRPRRPAARCRTARRSRARRARGVEEPSTVSPPMKRPNSRPVATAIAADANERQRLSLPAQLRSAAASDAISRAGAESGAATRTGGPDADGRIERDRPEPAHAEAPDRARLRHLAEHGDRLAAVRADERGHVLDRAEHADPAGREELEQPLRVEVRDVLRPDDDDHAVERQRPHQLLLHVARPRRQVDQQVVELAPRRLGDELAQQQLGRDRRQRERLVLADQEPDRHEPEPVHLDRRQRDRPAEAPELQLPGARLALRARPSAGCRGRRGPRRGRRPARRRVRARARG